MKIFLCIVIIVGLLTLRVRAHEKENIAKKKKSLLASYGKESREALSHKRIKSLEDALHRQKLILPMDHITWNDLGMEELFLRMDHCGSAAGEEYLYYQLHETGHSEKALEDLEWVISACDKDPEKRTELQFLLTKLGFPGEYSLEDYLEYLTSGEARSAAKHFPALALYVLFLVLCFFYPLAGILCMLALIAFQVFSYFSEKAKLLPYLTGLSYIVRLIESCREIAALDFLPIKPEREELQKCHEMFRKADTAGNFVLRSSAGGQILGSGSGPAEVLTSYLNLLFHLDLIAYGRVLTLLKGKQEELLSAMHTIGRLDACISIASFRASLRHGYCIPEFTEAADDGILLKGGYHFLLEHPVKNSIETSVPILLTGSNASGKSTFLRMVALNAVMAQTVHTCLADRYRAPYYRIFSSIALTDDLSAGDSYFMAEIKSIKRILDAAQEPGRPVLCFVDEVLRGTNTSERIGASTEILREMASRGILFFAATHDRELTGYLEQEVRNMHFEERMDGADITFSYELLEGPASTKNALLLLRNMGFPEDLVLRAEILSESLDET